ncbi:MAG: hypothetical protein LAO09_07505, partial [Acidobacteriia bacterium]|nr:hypothetical protein [Terriglobia bacterium]
FPFTVTQAGNMQNTGSATQRPNLIPGQDPHLSNPDPSRWFNTSAFQFRAEAFNLYNTPQFNAPNAQFGTPGFGQITGTWLSNRQLQLGLKFLF